MVLFSKHRKRCVTIAGSLFAALVLVWLIGNLLVDDQLGVRKDTGDEALVAQTPSGTLREVFLGLPAEGKADSEIELLGDNSRAWAARWQLLAEARYELEISYFILDADIFGIAFLGHLLHRAREGVRVRILLDTIGTAMSRQFEGNDYLDALAETRNVSLKIYRPYFFRFRDAFLRLNPLAVMVSEHDKILIADGRRTLTGGRNIAREYLADPRDYSRSFLDADVLLTGSKIGTVFLRIFETGFGSATAHGLRREVVNIKDSAEDLVLAYQAMDAWLRGKRIPAKTARKIQEKGLSWIDDLEKLPSMRGALNKKSARAMTGEVQLLDSRPRFMQSDDPISRSLARFAMTAREEIFIQTPYLILSRNAVSMLEKAAARGVRITILTNSPVSTDNALSQAFFLEQWPEVMVNVPTLRLFVTGGNHTMHAKLGAVDGQLALIGTYNLDPLSMSFNGELVAAIWSAQFAGQLLSRPRRLISEGPPRVFEYRIARSADGRVKRDRDGNIIIAFGPEDHSSPDQWKAVQWFRKLIKIARKLPGTSALLWKSRDQDPQSN